MDTLREMTKNRIVNLSNEDLAKLYIFMLGLEANTEISDTKITTKPA
ncbi:hypothetical protein AGMMS49975_14630 [Clostridia bacterium]|nr:hypothetical protein AGMMS49975_14630 [Clostridia bacterium]